MESKVTGDVVALRPLVVAAPPRAPAVQPGHHNSPQRRSHCCREAGGADKQQLEHARLQPPGARCTIEEMGTSFPSAFLCYVPQRCTFLHLLAIVVMTGTHTFFPSPSRLSWPFSSHRCPPHRCPPPAAPQRPSLLRSSSSFSCCMPHHTRPHDSHGSPSDVKL